MKIFLSYSTLDKELAGTLKQTLEKYGIDVFLAHEDIEPSIAWRNRILEELEECHVFIPLLTENYKGSNWTDQEAGMAIAWKKIILPLKTQYDPYGFLSEYQAMKLRSEEVEVTCFEVIRTLAAKYRIGTKLKDTIIKKFGESINYDTAARNTELLLSLGTFSNPQINKIVEYALENDQIYHSYLAWPRLRAFIERNVARIATARWHKFLEIYKTSTKTGL